jgi:hypothetical protein
MNIKQIAYERYKLDWLSRHGFSLSDLIKEVGEYMEESDEDIVCSFDMWEHDCGFDGEIWVCFDEFLENEYQDIFYMMHLLSVDESIEYRKDIEEDVK